MANTRYPRRKTATRPRGVLPTTGPNDIRGIPRFNPTPLPSTGVSGNARTVSNSGSAAGRQPRSDIVVDSWGNVGHAPAFAKPSSPIVRQQAGLATTPHPTTVTV